MRGDGIWSGRWFWVVEVVLLVVGTIGFVVAMNIEDTWTLWRYGEHRMGTVDHVDPPAGDSSEYATWVRLGDLGLYRFTDAVRRDPGDRVDVVIDPNDLETANIWKETSSIVIAAFAVAGLPVWWLVVLAVRAWVRRVNANYPGRAPVPDARRGFATHGRKRTP